MDHEIGVVDTSMIASVAEDETEIFSLAVPLNGSRPCCGTRCGQSPSEGSSLLGATFNFTNAIIGAGAMGLGGAIASSGGLVSIVALTAFATLAKCSCDMVVELRDQCASPVTYERIGHTAFGRPGEFAVMLSKGLFAFGCLVAYIVVIKDNFAAGLAGAIYGDDSSNDYSSLVRSLLFHHEVEVTLLLCVLVILPTCLCRDVSYLAKASFVSVLAVAAIVAICIYLFIWGDVATHTQNGNFSSHWLEIKCGVLESIGTFVFAFVPHHTIDLTYESMAPKHRTLKAWKLVSYRSVLIAYILSTTLGVVVYMTFWEHTQSDLFQMYPPSNAIHAAKLFLSISMLLTFALPFFACREIVVLLANSLRKSSQTPDLGLVESMASWLGNARNNNRNTVVPDTLYVSLLPEGTVQSKPSWMLSGSETQLTTPYHVVVTVSLWATTISLALLAPNLGDVLDLVGSVSGSMIGFVLPGLFSIKLLGPTPMGVLMFVSGSLICIVGSCFSAMKLFEDA